MTRKSRWAAFYNNGEITFQTPTQRLSIIDNTRPSDYRIPERP
jgi:hypothetical protein